MTLLHYLRKPMSQLMQGGGGRDDGGGAIHFPR